MFKKAVRSQAKLKLAITGPSGSGKTFSALRLAKGLGAKIAVIDTENGSASLYSDQFEFDVLAMAPPFSVEKYTQAIEAALEYDVLIIDSITHAWAGEGGLLEEKEKLDSRGKGNSYTNWATITKKHEAFKSALLHSPIHLIVTMRSKQDYAQVEENGRKSIKKLGLAPIQREGMEYEFTVVFDAAMNHQVECSKDRTGLFTDKVFQVTEKTGAELKKWLESGAPAVSVKFLGETEASKTDPGEYLIPVTEELRGMKLKDVPREKLGAVLDWYQAKRKEGMTFGSQHMQFIDYGERFWKMTQDIASSMDMKKAAAETKEIEANQ